jgi:hypothetical protein
MSKIFFFISKCLVGQKVSESKYLKVFFISTLANFRRAHASNRLRNRGDGNLDGGQLGREPNMGVDHNSSQGRVSPLCRRSGILALQAAGSPSTESAGPLAGIMIKAPNLDFGHF